MQPEASNDDVRTSADPAFEFGPEVRPLQRAILLQCCDPSHLDLSSWSTISISEVESAEQLYLRQARHRFPGALENAGMASVRAAARGAAIAPSASPRLC